MNNQKNDQIKKLRGLLEDIDFTMLTTFADGRLHSRPMSTQELDDNGDLWFFTAKNTRKVAELMADNRINAAYSKPESNTYVSVYGTAEVVTDRARIEELWSPLYKAWFPEGLDDPTISLIKVSVESAEYWDAPSSTFMQLAGFVKALATGTEMSYGEHETIKLDQ